MTTTFDLAVVGAGAAGSAAAYYAAKAGLRVLLLEQYEIDHQRGSSYGYSRIIRYAYDNPIYIGLMKAAYPLWDALQEEAGEPLWVKTGGIDFARPGEVSFENTVRALGISEVPFELLGYSEMRARFPQFRLDDDQIALFQADAGVMFASRCVLAHVRLAQKHGAVVKDRTPVTRIRVNADGVQIDTTGKTFHAAKLVLAPGAWAGERFAELGVHLPLTILRAQENYFDAQPAADYEAERFPVFISHAGETIDNSAYGIPSVNGSGLKISLHGGPALDGSPTTADRDPSDTIVEGARTFARHFLPGTGDAPLLAKRVCLYTMTPDTHFVIDAHPQHPHVILASPCSGHGFKFSTLTGKILIDLAMTGTTPHDVSLFSLARFAEAPQDIRS